MKNSFRTFWLTALVVLSAFVMSACTREAATDALPTDIPQGAGGGGDPAVQATNSAAMDQLLSQGMTQTAQAVLVNPNSTALPGGPAVTPTPLAPAQTPTPVPPTATPAPTAVPTPSGPVDYTVQPGEWLYSIARKFNVDPKALIAANPQLNPNDVLKPGTVIKIPGGNAGAPPAGAGKTYVVKAGDTLFRIALNNNTTHLTLAQLNGIPAPYTVYPGQVLKMP